MSRRTTGTARRNNNGNRPAGLGLALDPVYEEVPLPGTPDPVQVEGESNDSTDYTNEKQPPRERIILMIPPALKREIKKLAREDGGRSDNSMTEILVRRGLVNYPRRNILGDLNGIE